MRTSFSPPTLTIATRSSPLALKQTELVQDWLQTHRPDVKVHTLPLLTQGDKNLTDRLSKIGGKGLFIKELEIAMQSGEADIAVHSMKDVPMILPEGFCIAAVSHRENPCDAFVSNRFSTLHELPPHATVGTSSLRRQMQLLHHLPHLNIKVLRGNVGSRLKKLDDGELDAIILAAAGLNRLDMSHRITDLIPIDQSIPSAGQGALAIECLSHRQDIIHLFESFHDPITHACVTAERALCRALEGGCHVPIASYASHQDNVLYLTGAVGTSNGETIIIARVRGTLDQAEWIGQEAATQLREQGAEPILDDYANWR